MYKLKDRAGVAQRAKKHGLHNTKRRKHRLALKVAEHNQKLQEKRIRRMIAHAMRTQGLSGQVAPQSSAKINMVDAEGTETQIEKEVFVNPENLDETVVEDAEVVVDEDTTVVDEDTQEPEKYPENSM